jgi:hypothetical protein
MRKKSATTQIGWIALGFIVLDLMLDGLNSQIGKTGWTNDFLITQKQLRFVFSASTKTAIRTFVNHGN